VEAMTMISDPKAKPQDVDRALALSDHAYVLEHGVFAFSGSPAKSAQTRD
jgi:ABC-type branched-subunit amino acid transport system ATPase component